MATLYIVGTPIGNLEDISLRALRILGEVDFVLCEDTRVTQGLLNRYDIKTKTISFHQHSDDKKTDQLLEHLAKGKNLALVTDAGTPGISDPGGKLVQAVIEKFNTDTAIAIRQLAEKQSRDRHAFARDDNQSVRIESVPGPSAVTAALSISGIPTDNFLFLGFPPHKKGRQTFLERIVVSDEPVVVYESKHRIIKFLDELQVLNKKIEKENKEIERMDEYTKKKKGIKKKKQVTSVVVCRELSKMHETVYRGDLKSISNKIKDNKDDQKGEFVVIVA